MKYVFGFTRTLLIGSGAQNVFLRYECIDQMKT